MGKGLAGPQEKGEGTASSAVYAKLAEGGSGGGEVASVLYGEEGNAPGGKRGLGGGYLLFLQRFSTAHSSGLGTE